MTMKKWQFDLILHRKHSSPKLSFKNKKKQERKEEKDFNINFLTTKFPFLFIYVKQN